MNLRRDRQAPRSFSPLPRNHISVRFDFRDPFSMQNPSVSSGSEATAVPGSRHEHTKPPSARGWTAETTQEPRYPHEVQDPRPVSSTSATVRAHRCRTTAIHSLIVRTASNAFRLLPGSSMLHFAVVPVADTAWFDLTYIASRRWNQSKEDDPGRLARSGRSSVRVSVQSQIPSSISRRDLPPGTCHSPRSAQVEW